MPANYIWRMDDVTAAMDWPRFWRYMDLFARFGVRPLLGVVPANRDPRLEHGTARSDFRAVLRQLKDDGAIEIAQHGYCHLAETASRSEFAGLPYDRQYRRIAAGKRLLAEMGLATTVFMAPFHSFDRTTLAALAALDFTAITDGTGLYPFRAGPLTFVPQQLWRPRRFPCGYITICLHVGELPDSFHATVADFLASGVRSVNFSEAASYVPTGLSASLNLAVRPVYAAARIWRAGRAIARARPRMAGAKGGAK